MKLSSRKKTQIDMQMTSMIDCVFLLLIFFMVTSSFALAERELDPGIKIERASSRAASDLAPAIVDVVHGTSEFVFRLGGRDFTAQADLTDILRKFDNKLDGAFVRAADDAPFDMAAAAIQSCKDAGFQKVSYVPLADKN